jgi:hypothetical protein
MMVPGAKTVFDEALEVAAFPTHEAVAEQKLQMASGMAHYAYLCLDITSTEYTQLQQRIQMVRQNRSIKEMRADRIDARV